MKLRQRLQHLHHVGLQRSAPSLFPDVSSANHQSFKPAAVLIAITEREEPGLLLLHRPTHMRAHAGQVALPGGRIDPGETPVEAALREAQEELGLDPALVTVIGTGDLFHTSSGYAITPVIATVPADIAITPNPAEVSQWFEAPFAYVLDPANHIAREAEWQGARRRYVEILCQEHRIWGVTGAILANLANRLNWHDLNSHG